MQKNFARCWILRWPLTSAGQGFTLSATGNFHEYRMPLKNNRASSLAARKSKLNNLRRAFKRALDPELYQLFKTLAKDDGVSVGELGRTVIEAAV